MSYNGYPDQDAFHAAMRAEWDKRHADEIAYQLASRDASLGVGHVWTATACPAYRTYRPEDCTCGA